MGKLADNAPKPPESPRQEARDSITTTARANEKGAAVLDESSALLRQAVPATDIVSPNAAIRWRLGSGGSVQYSSDGGATWETLSTGASQQLTAGSSPSGSVCWIVGRGGIVLLTTDGRRWQRLPFPEAVDLTTVHADDARRATVTTIDGRTFRTENAGLTWTRVPLQGF